MVPTISTTCIQCGMEKGHSLLYCPPCTLVNNQKEQFEQLQRNADRQYYGPPPPSTWGEIIGGIVGIILFFSLLTYWISDKGFWESVETVLWIPVAVIAFFLTVFGII